MPPLNDPSVVLVLSEQAAYPACAPFSPDEPFPELGPAADRSLQPNHIYRAVREALHLAGLDAGNFGKPTWNPLGEFIRPTHFVLLKPNLVKEYHPRDPQGWIYTITHGSVIRAVADYVWKALEGRGRVMIADAPQTDSRFDKIVTLLQLDKLQTYYRGKGLDLELADLRKEEWVNVEEVIVDRRPLPGDPNGCIAFDLADRSEFIGHVGAGRYYGADYDDGEVNRHHTSGRHEYLFSGSAVQCDVFINLPKLKTHKKTGVTLNLKNLVGVNGDKNWLPHHTVGTPRDGGDQFPSMTLRRTIEHHTAATLRKVALGMPGVGTRLLRRARKAGKRVFGDNDRVVRSGNWHGNDTTWRMCLDLNKIVLYGRPDGTFRAADHAGRKTYLSFIDGVVGGQGNGPMDPDPLPAGAILFGADPGSVDAAAASLMGFDVEKIPLITTAFAARGFPVSFGDWRSIDLRSNHPLWSVPPAELARSAAALKVVPHFGWVGHIEASRYGMPQPCRPCKLE